MRVLLDNNVDHRYAHLLPDHVVVHVREMGWESLRNGDLIAIAEQEGFDVLMTADKNLSYQQNLAGRRISIVTFRSLLVTYRHIAPLAPEVERILSDLLSGSFVSVGGSGDK